ncbi:hypothetical protein CTAYLR_001802 [Chrysophaeum taylorii]|uniref:Uncharacterized protein n=1 Tax=Chrysophaeum taylorii TaxID=2483200 RepID=A0AAD7U8T1_9STRA|nr:hypothetical protein CTAYLR_001802 [Chrysophaeum taylorii]
MRSGRSPSQRIVRRGGRSLVDRPAEELLDPTEHGQARVLACIRNGARIVAAQIVCCDQPLDSAHPRASAALWIMDARQPQYERQPHCLLQGELRTVNERARELDQSLAARIVPSVDAVVAISADARRGGANAAVLRAAGARRAPVAGTGGSSLSLAAAMYGCELAGNAGGSVATTARTKAIGVAASLAGVWREPYAPRYVGPAAPLRSVVNECVPALVCVACARAASSAAPAINELLGSGLLVAPAVGALAAARRSDLGSVATLAGASLGAFCRGSSCCALVACGVVFPLVAPHVLAVCARYGVPATSSNIAIAGAVPVVLGAACYWIVAPLAVELADAARWLIRSVLSWWVASAAVGVAINYGSRKDWYHAYFLPLVALEHEKGDMSTIGALDCLCLCVCGAGACAAQLLVDRLRASYAHLHTPTPNPTHQQHQQQQTYAVDRSRFGVEPAAPRAAAAPRQAPSGADVALARRGFFINLLCGDYVEACHPFLDRDSTLDAAVYLASFLAGAISAGSRSSAYLPLPVSILLADEAPRFALAAVVALVLPLLVGVASNMYHHHRRRKVS